MCRDTFMKIPYIEALKNIALLFTSLLVVFCVAEILVRLFITMPFVGPFFSVYDPLLGKRLKKSFSGTIRTPEFTTRVSTNSYGFRGPEPISFPYRPIMFLGDSFTMGYGVNDGEEYPSLVGDALMNQNDHQPIPIVNTGIGNNGNGRWLKFLRGEARQFNPSLVVFQLFKNDFEENLAEKFFELSGDGQLRELPVPPIDNVRRIQNMIDLIPGLSSSRLIALANNFRRRHDRDVINRVWNNEAEINNEKDQLTYRILEEAITICKSEDWPMLVLIIGIQGQRLKKLRRLFEQRDITAIIIPDKIKRPDLYFENDGHWNDKGQLLAAQLTLKELQRSLNFIGLRMSTKK